MYLPKFELRSFSSLPVQRKQIVLRALLEALVVADWNYLLENPGLPSVYDIAPQYVLKVRPSGLDAWQDIPQTIALGSGDCIAAGTMIETETGPKAIESIVEGERVVTRGGLQRVLKSGLVRFNAPIIHLNTESRRTVCATPEHRVWSANRDWTPVGELKPGDSVMEFAPDGKHAITKIISVISGLPTAVYDLTVENWPEFFAGGILVHNCKDFACLSANTQVVVKDKGEIPISQVTLDDFVATRLGWRAVRGTQRTRRNAETQKFILSNGRELVGTTDHRILTLNRDWTPLGELRTGDIMLASDGSDGSKSCEQVTVQAIESGLSQDVYDLAIEDAHEFFANGVLVHNCWRIAELRNKGYDDVYPHIKVSYHDDPRGQEPPMTVYHIQVRIHDTIEDPSAVLGMPTHVTYDQLRG